MSEQNGFTLEFPDGSSVGPGECFRATPPQILPMRIAIHDDDGVCWVSPDVAKVFGKNATLVPYEGARDDLQGLVRVRIDLLELPFPVGTTITVEL